MFLKVVKNRQPQPSGPVETIAVEYHEGERIYAERVLEADGAQSAQAWRITVERSGGSETLEKDPRFAYYLLNNNGKTIDSL